MNPKKPSKPRSANGIHEESRRGAVKNSIHIPNRKGNGAGKSACLRCGDPSHHWRDCPHPYREKLGPRFSSKGKGKTFALEQVIPEPTVGFTGAIPPNQKNAAGGQGPNDTPAPPTQVDAGVAPAQHPSMSDIWAQYYAQNDPTAPTLINVCQASRLNSPDIATEMVTYGAWQSTPPVPPPILIDSGESCSAVGGEWRGSRGKQMPFSGTNPHRSRVPILETFQSQRGIGSTD